VQIWPRSTIYKIQEYLLKGKNANTSHSNRLQYLPSLQNVLMMKTNQYRSNNFGAISTIRLSVHGGVRKKLAITKDL
jgi:hypothetical protein